MKSVVIYASRYGNTRRIAEAIAEALQAYGEAQLFPADEMLSIQPESVDLVVIGGPTEMRRMTKPVVRLFSHMGRWTLRGAAAAAFDTRLREPRALSGSAGAGIARKLRRAGARLLAPEESFFVKSQANHEEPELEPGELKRATAWAVSLAALLALTAQAAPPATQS